MVIEQIVLNFFFRQKLFLNFKIINFKICSGLKIEKKKITTAIKELAVGNWEIAYQNATETFAKQFPLENNKISEPKRSRKFNKNYRKPNHETTKPIEIYSKI